MPNAASSCDPTLAAAARAAADQSAQTAGVVIEDLIDHAGTRQAAAVFDAIWARDGGSVLTPESLTVLAHAGSQVTIARRGAQVVGATAAFLGRDCNGTAFLHSHVTGVVAPADGNGVGRALKWHQRAWCLERDIARVRWTFDPLIRRNAVFNLVLLGARVSGYLPDCYGRLDDARNRGMPTDRAVVDWDLTSPRVRAAAEGRAASPDVTALRRAGTEVVLDDGAQVATTTGRRLLARIPEDIEALRLDDPDTAQAWSQAIRSVLLPRLEDGWRITGFSRDGWYVLAAETHTEELRGQR